MTLEYVTPNVRFAELYKGRDLTDLISRLRDAGHVNADRINVEQGFESPHWTLRRLDQYGAAMGLAALRFWDCQSNSWSHVPASDKSRDYVQSVLESYSNRPSGKFATPSQRVNDIAKASGRSQSAITSLLRRPNANHKTDFIRDVTDALDLIPFYFQ